MKRIYLLALFCLTVTASSAKADMFSISASADSTVDALDPDATRPTGDLEATMIGTVDQPAEALTFFYAQFQLPDGMTGQDIASINSIDLKVTRSPTSSTLSLEYYLYGVFDGLDTDSVDTYSWNDGVGYDPANTLVKFLNPNNEEIFYYSDPAESGFVGFISVVPEGPPQRQFGFFPTQADFAVQNLHDLILNDTDGIITFFGKVRPNFAVTELQRITSIEDGTRPGPTLELDVVIGPQVTPGDFDGDGDVDGADFVAWQTNFPKASGATLAEGDADGDGDVDGADFVVWQTNFPFTPGPGASPVPEPTTWSLATLGGLVALAGWRRRK